jgi:DNA-cytosine methyltransferase
VLCQGLEALGGRCVFASERDIHACTTYHANFGDVPFGDITQVDAATIPAHDLLTAGFPCQSFSKAGALNPGTGQQGLGDANGKLFFEVVRVLEALQPRAFLLENVAELLTHDEGRSRAVVLAALRGVGYSVDYRVINSVALLPQHRERLYLVGLRADLVGASADSQDSWTFSWPPGLEVGARCVSEQPFGRRCPCRRLDTSGTPALRQILQSENELPSDIWLTSTQWSKIARGGAGDASRGTSQSIVTPSGSEAVVEHRGGSGDHVGTGSNKHSHCRCCRRLAWLDGAARTLMSSYRRGYEMCSEFVRSPVYFNCTSIVLQHRCQF